jgi:hypothetical protein
MTKILQFVALIILMLAIGAVFIGGLAKSERAECATLQAQAFEYAEKGFYLTDWQKEMCEYRGVPVILQAQ